MPVSVKSFRENVPQKDSSPSQQAIYTSLGIGPAQRRIYDNRVGSRFNGSDGYVQPRNRNREELRESKNSGHLQATKCQTIGTSMPSSPDGFGS